MKREFFSFFVSPIAYIFLTLFLIITNFVFFQSFFIIGESTMRGYFDLLPWLFLMFLPAVTMRSWAEEKKHKTLELLLTWPLSDYEVVLGKFLASLLFLLLALLLSFTVPLTVNLVGNPDMGVIIASYIGALFLGGAYIAIGMAISSVTENQIVAFIGTVVIILAFLLMGQDVVVAYFPTNVSQVLLNLSFDYHFKSIARGVLDSRDVIYYLSIIGFFLFLNVQSLESRKWD
jgi:ABC-2 type transport system permease protein